LNLASGAILNVKPVTFAERYFVQVSMFLKVGLRVVRAFCGGRFVVFSPAGIPVVMS
jgi:hypothetical protein